MMYIDGQDFITFISQLCTKWTITTALGTKIDDLVFRMILLNSLPQSWDSIVATLYTTKSLHNAVMLYKSLGKISDNLHPNNQNNRLERRAWPP